MNIFLGGAICCACLTGYNNVLFKSAIIFGVSPGQYSNPFFEENSLSLPNINGGKRYSLTTINRGGAQLSNFSKLTHLWVIPC